jgi:NAD+ kinase
LKVAIYSRVLESTQQKDVQLFFDELEKEGIEPVIFTEFFEKAAHHLKFPPSTATFSHHSELTTDIDFLISLGDEMSEAVKALARRSYVIDKRSLIHLDSNIPLFNEVPYGLNEFAIHKRDIAPMIKIHTYINGELLNTYWADGLILATPTGSTGYSLSCAGPVVFPESGSFVLTPIAPHNLNVRPIVIPDNTIVSFEIESRADEVICALDSRRELVDKNVLLAVRKENFAVNLVRLNENNFLQTLRNKLSWGLDKRN